MVSNLVLTGMYNIGVTDEKYLLNGEKTSIKDVPFVRYRLNEYNEEVIKYIKDMQSKFKHSVHLVEVELGENTADTMEFIKSNLDNVAIYIYVKVYDNHVENGLSEDILGNLSGIAGTNMYDRIMIKDCSNSLYLVAANNMKAKIRSIVGGKEADIGICSSPLSFCGEACLSSVQARNLIAIYSTSDECKIPSANHECMNTCGCIRHSVINSDIPAPIKKTGGGAGKKKSASDGTPKKLSPAKKVSKAPIEWL